MVTPSVIVDDLHIGGPLCRPDEADAPLLIDAYAVLSLPITLQRFEAVARRHLQIVKNCRSVQLRKLAKGRPFDVHPTLHALSLEEGLGVLALEALDRHAKR
jgi:hypothetical protein